MTEKKRFYFIGIKGSGMSALALLLHGMGHEVRGSDVEKYFFTEDGLRSAGIPILSFSPANLEPGWEVILGNAFPDDHPEAVAARKLGLPMARYHQFLGALLKKYTSVAVTGSHGKTSTTGLLSHVLKAQGPTNYLIGDGTGHGEPGAEYFALEADEYRAHFLAYEPTYAIFLNIDFDHPDYYDSIEQVYEANRKFAGQVKTQGLLYSGDPYLAKFQDLNNMLYYGFQDEDEIQAIHIERSAAGAQFDVLVHGELYGHFMIHACGDHNILNALAVIGFCALENFDGAGVAQALASFKGVKRRFNITEKAGYTLVDDYAHHPKEIEATIAAARQRFPKKPVLAIFQPHTYSRTLALLDDFAKALNQADRVYVCDIFSSAREQDTHQVSADDLLDQLTVPKAHLHLKDIETLKAHQDAVMLFMGAGDVPKYKEALEEKL